MFQPPASQPPCSGHGRDDDGGAPRAGAGFAHGGEFEGLEPGTVLASMTRRAFEQELTGLSDDELVGLLGASQRLSAWQAAIEFGVIGELDKRRTQDKPASSRTSDQVSDELAVAMTMTSRSADVLLSQSRELARLPMVRRALYKGKIDRARAVVFAQELAGLSDVAASAVAMAFWRIAGSMTTGQLRMALRTMVRYLDPVAARRRAAKGRTEARVEMWQENSGNAALAGRELSPAEAVSADQRITEIAQELKRAGAQGTLDQLRAAVFAALLTGRSLESLRPDADPASSEPGATAGLAALTGSVHLTMPLSAWLGWTDVPGEAAGYGPLDADACRDLAGRLAAAPGTRWSVTLTGKDGRAVGHARARAGPRVLSGAVLSGAGPPAQVAAWVRSLRFDWLEGSACGHSRRTASYRPGSRLQRLIEVRDRTCTFPGCRRPARRCDLDHTTPFDEGGVTCECNLACLCRRHHQVKQAPGWHLAQAEPGVLIWTAPHGRSYTTGPGIYLT